MRPSSLLLLVLLTGAASGCTGGGGETREAFPTPPASSFREGTCALVAEDLLTIGRLADALEPPAATPEVREELEAAQRVLAGAAATAEPEVAPQLEAVVTRTGLLRLTLDAERFDEATREDLSTSYRALVDACTGPAPAPPAGGPGQTPSATGTATTG